MSTYETPRVVIDPRIARRHFFSDCGYGLGKIALASLLADSIGAPTDAVGRSVARRYESAGGSSAPLSGEGEARHSSVHGGGAESA